MSTTSIIAIVLAALVGFLTSKAALEWAAKNGKNLGRWVAKKVPGDKLEEWLIAFLEGIADGLKSEVEEDDNNVSVSANSTKLSVSKSKLRAR